MSSINRDTFETLRGTIESTKALIDQFEKQIQTATLPVLPIDESSPNALKLAADTFSILKAQTTKLTLLILNKPFSPSEITIILKSLCNECIPAMVSVCQICPRQNYTNYLFRIIRSSVGATFKMYLGVLDEIPVDEAAVDRIRRQKTLNSTGMLWDGLDFVIKAGKPGFGLTAIAATRVTEIHALLKDAVSELEDWKTGEVDSHGVLDRLISSEEKEKAPEELREEYPAAHRHVIDAIIPGAEKEAAEQFNALSSVEDNPFGLPKPATPYIQPAAKKAITAIKLLSLLPPPINKRRIQRFPVLDSTTPFEAFPTEKQCDDFDFAMIQIQGFGDIADATAEALYLNDIETVEERLHIMVTLARRCISRVRKTWDGGEDEFTRWIDKWLVKLEEMKAMPSAGPEI